MWQGCLSQSEPSLAAGSASNDEDDAHIQSVGNGGRQSWAKIVDRRGVNKAIKVVEQPNSWGSITNSDRSSMDLEYFSLSNNCLGIIDIDDDM
ncbi:hypothetical protein U1Q18_048393, partial [Sarracenia purpurea var. burkii]